jgi:CRISPR-associated exonuclease Cas4
MEASDLGGVHIKYLYHCRRQLWLYTRGIRPEHLNARVQLGEAVHDTSYSRSTPVDLGAARLDHLDGRHWVHEVKSSSQPTSADQAQAIHYCHQLHRVGVEAQGAVLHYPKTRRTVRITYGLHESA